MPDATARGHRLDCTTCRARWGGQPGRGRCLGHTGEFDLFEAMCGLDGKRFTPTMSRPKHLLALPRSGAYVMRTNGVPSIVDATVAVLTGPADELSSAHPFGAGDTFTAVEIEPVAVAQREGEWTRAAPVLPLDDDLDLRHRLLVSACRRGTDGFGLADQVHALLDRLLPAAVARPAHFRRPETTRAHRGMVAAARAALLAGTFTLGLDELAVLVGCSPHHLSRVFRQVTGETLTTYRNRLRVRAVLADMQDGATNLRSLAAAYGFADQAHLTRVVRRQLGERPSAIRRMLGPPRIDVQRRGQPAGAR